MGKGMQNYVVDPMPVENFLNKFLPNPEDYDTSDFASHFASASNAEVFDMQSIKKEEDSYDRFMSNSALMIFRSLTVLLQINGIRPFAPQLLFVNSSKHADTNNCSSFTFNVKPDVCVYADGTLHGCNISKFKVNIEFKWNDVHDAFRKHPGVDQLITSPALRGVDTSVTPASNEDAALARMMLKLTSTMRMLKVAVPQDPAVEDSDWLTLIIPQPVAKGFSLVGRWTRTCPAFDILNNRVVMFKDSWRMLLKDVLPEGETYRLLRSHNVHNVATCIAFHDVIHATPERNTQTVKFGSAEWACPNKAVTPHILHHLVLDLVGKQLTDFESSHQLVQSVRDALLAHQDAYKNAKILHRDLSVGNIGPRQTTRTGTWQFMSAHLVKNSFAIHAVEDDLESGLYVVLWTALKYRESYMSIIDRTQFILQIFDADPLVGTGGSAKSDWLVARTYFPRDIFIGCKPLDNLVVELAQFFSHQYSLVSPEAQESLVRLWLSLQEVLDEAGSVHMAAQQKMIDVAQCCLLESSAYQKEIGMQILHSHKAVINIYDKYLGSSGWPDKDAAVLQKVHPTNKQSGCRLYTKSLCASQDLTSTWVQVTPSGNKCRLDPEGDVEILSSVAGLDGLVSFDQ
ncbi:uncharacterized protein F5147DRAFT_774104 [Suillus discolor]|uniref:Fungal-type protein kinase domain-containing protein n=1 Tax=Suillus discolor TaxID=1912936 RepID=A0A9P7F734_9AGAM|nr:uncharacterized protein F5147DRAFT_774104 [Suillus discolor]KAG2107656.1 hypothetical protein F5147DRAFT_774104 [Suillus discolor]